MDLNGKVALVTGAAQGIGKACVDHLLQHNVKVMLSDINSNVAEATRQEMAKKYGDDKVKFIKCDVTKDEQFEGAIKQTIETFKTIDILINNAGVAIERDPGWKDTININLVGSVKGTYLGMKYMGKDQGHNGGTVINIASITTFGPFDCLPVYSATKSAINQFSRSVGTKLHFDRTGVRVISMNLGTTDTDIVRTTPNNILPETLEFYNKVICGAVCQSIENMGRGFIEILKKAESGTLWLIEDNLPQKQINFIVEKFD